jgi:hypothetical protein
MNTALHHPLRIVVIGVAVAIALVALLPGTWAEAQTSTAGAPPSPSTVTVTVVVNGNQETIVTTPGGLASITIPAGSQITSVSVTLVTSPEQMITNLSGSMLAVYEFVAQSGESFLGGGVSGVGFSGGNFEIGYVFAIGFDSAASTLGGGPQLVMNGGALAQLQLSEDALQTGTELAVAASATLNVLPETLAQVGGDLSRLIVVYVDPANSVIEPVTMLPSPGPGVLAFEFTKDGSYAVMVAPLTADEIAGGPAAPVPADTGMGAESGATDTVAIVLGVVALGGILGLGGRYALRRRSA